MELRGYRIMDSSVRHYSLQTRQCLIQEKDGWQRGNVVANVIAGFEDAG